MLVNCLAKTHGGPQLAALLFMMVDGNNFISHFLKTGKSFAAGKIGVTELNILYNYFILKQEGKLLEHLRHEVENIAGMYPFSEKTVINFSENLLDKLQFLDLIPRWNKVIPDFEDFIFKQYCNKAHITKLEHLEPYFFTPPWTDFLRDKKVLVFSPFKESIDLNFKKLNLIWNNKITNNFNLKVIKYPFSLPISNNNEFKESNDVYLKYADILNKEDFDVGIFGTGYTSLLFTLQAKMLGKSGIHLGGSTQILFGVKGRRWKEIDKFHSFFNEHWTEPLNNEKPEKHSIVEGGCYW